MAAKLPSKGPGVNHLTAADATPPKVAITRYLRKGAVF